MALRVFLLTSFCYFFDISFGCVFFLQTMLMISINIIVFYHLFIVVLIGILLVRFKFIGGFFYA